MGEARIGSTLFDNLLGQVRTNNLATRVRILTVYGG